ncbi:peptidyl-prolyl cis-trans isomerase [Cellvibrio zantedeschiae]|uniref:Peptidyl-prolyl cis-trans isomerase n=1 Tax=Cellvibrio zantedeschiae TaxID=1237077 RepID=A0ABQ3BAD5_9GAMM|nr:FKBP-type peptidyl-prolyl cis-trans isomerase [Cellvibrio zantedeschiae]GGY83010.1 peptidyl-prolyl cis-trans isomerase [Cellvibrio zantedeschiae]
MINKKLAIIGLMASAALVAGCKEDAKKQAPKLDTLEQKVSYLIGQNIGSGIKQNDIALDQDSFLLGLNDAKNALSPADQEKLAALKAKAPESLTKEEKAELDKLNASAPRISQEDAVKIMEEFKTNMTKKKEEEAKKLAETNKAAGEKFLAENKTKEGVKTTESGLQYKVITEGTGVKPKQTDTVKVHYTGKLLDGTVFDSSVKRGEPVEFPVGGVIAGWVEALQLMPQGSKWEVYIPAGLAYGDQGQQQIPPASTLIFEVELLEVKSAAAAEEKPAAKPAKK